MPNRDALWVRPDGTTSVVTLDEQGNPAQPIASEPQAPAEPDIPATEPVKPTRKRRKR
jgi:hypothetical protein